MARSSPRKKPTVNYNEGEAPKPLARAVAKVKSLAAKATHKRKAAAEEADDGEVNGHSNGTPAAPAPKKRRTAKASKDEQGGMPLAERTAVASLKKAMYIGAHVSAAGGVQNSIPNAVHIGANAFALFLKSQRKWDNPAMTDEARDLFLHNCKEHGYDAGAHALPHGSYLVNLAQPDAAKADQAYASFVDDLRRCEQLGVRLYNFHPGSTLGDARPAAVARIAAQLNKAHRETSSVVTVLENMAGGGNVIGATWEDLRDVIALVDDKDRVGVCIDTCHAFAAGHDLRTPEAFDKTMDAFNDVVGAKYLKAFHRTLTTCLQAKSNPPPPPYPRPLRPVSVCSRS
ncbi:DNA-(apurinic or apyrimidinic site) lyase [Purpureocillium takamizusanense]|uniref:Apurinic-apyrimidinic endonuclease 1 n=1 Tax=Purpureocillium takamizusanense TaxID=2060973 RepID=A0A9Q8V6U6_9HYPO|nr:DNA-(apurinic or apyrimidinic site) lyase [Purpureocillium takamizusanense]UNI15260.1 DNA-(apurinic or apyrimidinic site) lyase [Purpureocillium takamizusanense]